MRALVFVVMLPGVALADASVAQSADEIGCGTAAWRAMAEAVDAYCRDEAAATEALGCRVARHAFARCEGALQRSTDEHGQPQASGRIADPRRLSYAWLLHFALERGRWRLLSFRYLFDDCTAAGIPPPPRGRVRLADVRFGAP